MYCNDYIWIGIIPFGLIFIIVGLSLKRKSGLFNSTDCVQVEARVTKIYKAQSSHSGNKRMRRPVYIAYADYTVDGREVSGKHFEPVRHSFIKFRAGELITVKVNPEKPKLFCIDTVDSRREYATSVKMIVFGVIVDLAGIFFLIV